MECPQDLVASNVEIKNNGVTQDIAKGLRVLNKNVAKGLKGDIGPQGPQGPQVLQEHPVQTQL